MAAQLDPEHRVCMTTYGLVHDWDDARYLTVDHFWPDYSVKGKRAPSSMATLVAMCGEGNRLWGPAHREEERAWVQRRR